MDFINSERIKHLNLQDSISLNYTIKTNSRVQKLQQNGAKPKGHMSRNSKNHEL